MDAKKNNKKHFAVEGVFCDCHPPKKLKYGKPSLGESMST